MKKWADVNALYQIYPRSFKDTTGDGVGDLKGITQKLPYVKDLGVDAIWLSPVYMSPQRDCGYDISDYCQIDPLFGNMDDMDALISTAHNLDLRVMMDLVANHTSDQHHWFQQAKLSRTNPYRDYYVWRDAKPDGTLPTNWVSMAGGSMWEYDSDTNQYYLHSFLPDQPDLNWDNPKVRQEVKDIMRFWLNKGVDGFRVDAEWPISKIYEDEAFLPGHESAPNDYGSFLHNKCKNGPNMLTYMSEIGDTLKEYNDAFIVYEYYTDEQYGDEVGELVDIFRLDNKHMSPFVFDMMRLDWHAGERAARMQDLYKRMPAGSMPFHALGNHDQPRAVTHFGEQQARALAVAQLSLPGIPTIYYGEELGMQNFAIPEGMKQDKFKEGGGMAGRDPERTPMQWDASDGAGFTTDNPWLPIGQNHTVINVESESDDPQSFYALYKKLLGLRQSDKALRSGAYQPLDTGNGYVWAFSVGDKQVYVNFADQPQTLANMHGTAIVSSITVNAGYGADGDYMLHPYEAVVVQTKKEQA